MSYEGLKSGWNAWMLSLMLSRPLLRLLNRSWERSKKGKTLRFLTKEKVAELSSNGANKGLEVLSEAQIYPIFTSTRSGGKVYGEIGFTGDGRAWYVEMSEQEFNALPEIKVLDLIRGQTG